LNPVAADIFHDTGDRRYRGDDVELFFRLGGLFVFLPATGAEKKCQSQNRQSWNDCSSRVLKMKTLVFTLRQAQGDRVGC